MMFVSFTCHVELHKGGGMTKTQITKEKIPKIHSSQSVDYSKNQP